MVISQARVELEWSWYWGTKISLVTRKRFVADTNTFAKKAKTLFVSVSFLPVSILSCLLALIVLWLNWPETSALQISLSSLELLSELHIVYCPVSIALLLVLCVCLTASLCQCRRFQLSVASADVTSLKKMKQCRPRKSLLGHKMKLLLQAFFAGSSTVHYLIISYSCRKLSNVVAAAHAHSQHKPR